LLIVSLWGRATHWYDVACVTDVRCAAVDLAVSGLQDCLLLVLFVVMFWEVPPVFEHSGAARRRAWPPQTDACRLRGVWMAICSACRLILFADVFSEAVAGPLLVSGSGGVCWCRYSLMKPASEDAPLGMTALYRAGQWRRQRALCRRLPLRRLQHFGAKDQSSPENGAHGLLADFCSSGANFV